jgi:4-hydroxy-tetrahydrodipicolinate synthase
MTKYEQMRTQIKGIFTALISPMTENGIDVAAYEKLIEWQIEQGVHGIVPCGTTGESPTLTHDEHKKLIEIAVKVANGRVHVMAGTGSNSTAETLELTAHAKKVGAHSALLVAPYYNKPNQIGLYEHFKHVADKVDIPIILYNIPPRSIIDIHDDTIIRLSDNCANIVGVKDATGDLTRVAKLNNKIGARLTLLSGDDMTAVAFNIMGGNGCISVASNVAPKLYAQMQNHCLNGDYLGAQKLHMQLVDLNEILFSEVSPAPVKYAMHRLGFCQDVLRLPMVEVQDLTKERVDAILFELGLI